MLLYDRKRQNSAELGNGSPMSAMSTSKEPGVIGGLIRGFEQAAPPPPSPGSLANNGPLIVHTALLTLTTREFDRSRGEIERIVTAHQGYIANLSSSNPTDQGRSLTATLRLPAARLDIVLSDLKKLGRVEAESQSGEEVTQQYVDLEARLQNARNTEQRLTQLLRNRTGKLSDVLAVEEQIDATRGQIETMQAEQKSLSKRIAFATLQLRLSEEYKESLGMQHDSTSTRLRNAAIDGYRNLAGGTIDILLFLLTYGPALLLVVAVLFFPLWILLKRTRREPGL